MHHLEALIVKWSNPLQSSRWLEKRKTSGIAVIKRVFNFSWSQLLFDPSLSIALRVVRKLWLSLRHSNLWTSHCLELSFSITPQYQKLHLIREKHKSPSESRLPYSSAHSFVLKPCRKRLYLFSLFIYLLCLLETKAYSHHFICLKVVPLSLELNKSPFSCPGEPQNQTCRLNGERYN